MPDAPASPRPLPECLTRFLEPQPARSPPREAVRRAAWIVAPEPARPNRALHVMLLWAAGYNLIGFLIIGLLWKSMQ